MNNLKRILSITLGGIILVGTTSLGATGIVNAPNGLVLREEASKSANPLMTVSDDSKVEIIEKDGEWYKVKYASQEGYLFAEYVEEETIEATENKEEVIEETTQTIENEEEQTEETTENQEETTQTATQKQNVKSDVKIYSIPSITAKTIVTVEKDSEITVNYELNNWVNITYGNVTGWARKYFINNETTSVETDTETTDTEVTENQEVEEEKEPETTVTVIDNKKGYVDVSTSANIREKASTDSEIVERLLRNTEIIITAEEGDFYKIKYQDITGYISKSLVSDEPIEEVTSRGNNEEREITEEEKIIEDKEETTEETDVETVVSNTTEGNEIASFAKQYVGDDYVSGGSSPSTGFDCSGLAYYVYNQFGYSIGRTCSAQVKMGTQVARENLSAGDLIFFCNGANGSIGHVGIYIGGGQFVHAANSIKGVRVDTINEGYYNKYYYTARRIVD